MDLQDQLKKLFPNHQPSEETTNTTNVEKTPSLYLQKEPLLCKYEKRKGKPITIIDGYNGSDKDFKQLAKEIKTHFSVGGGFKNDTIIIQGDYRDRIMLFLQEKGFKTKRVGG